MKLVLLGFKIPILSIKNMKLNSSTGVEYIKFKSWIESFYLFKSCMPSHVGPVIVGGFSQENEAVLEEVGRQYISSVMDSNIYFE
jgi:hypothetical protein